MADLTIHELQNTATAPANDDYMVLDGATAGTRKIDANLIALKSDTDKLADSTAPEFSTSVSYGVSAPVMYQGQLYRCTMAHSAGAWNPQHFALDTATHRIKDLATTKYKGFMALDDADGTGKMDVDTIFNNFADKFVDNVTEAKASKLYMHNGSLYAAKEDYQGLWDSSKFTACSVSDVVESQQSIFDFEHLPKSVNLFDGTSKATQGYYDTNGVFVTTSGYACTNPIFVCPFAKYKYPFNSSQFSNNPNVFISDKSGNILSVIAGSVESNFLTFEVDKFCYVVLNIGVRSDVSSFMLCEYSEYPGSYVSGSKDYVLNKSIKVDDDNIDGEVGYKHLPTPVYANGLVVDKGVNWFNKNSTSIKNNYFINGQGQYVSASSYSVSHPIAVAKGFTYKYNVLSQSAFGGNKYLAYISPSDGETITDVITYSESSNVATFTAPKDGLVRFSYNGSTDSVMFALADRFPDSYVTYRNRIFENDIDLSEHQLEQARSGVLSGKILSVNGDSICYGNGYAGGYAGIIADTYGMTLENLAVNGRKMCYYGNNTAICRDILNMRSDADYAIVEGGVNDMSNSSVGSLTEGYNSALDDSTLYGAFETMCKNLQTRFAGKKVGYIAVHKIRPSFSSMVEDGVYAIAKKCCQKWSIPFCDLNNLVPPWDYWRPYDSALTPLCNAYTKDGDGWHPNEQAYRKYYVPNIVSWLESL